MAKILIWTSPLVLWYGVFEAVRWLIKGVSFTDALGVFATWLMCFIAQVFLGIACYLETEDREYQ
ncbi:MAG: hypothetical protein ACM3JF_02015 [Sphaerimonospora mesophila]